MAKFCFCKIIYEDGSVVLKKCSLSDGGSFSLSEMEKWQLNEIDRIGGKKAKSVSCSLKLKLK